MILEICATNIQSALHAQTAGAHRIELCSALDVGGLTPSYGLVRAACQALSIPVMVLIRPREGHFVFQEEEKAIMLDDIRFCAEAGAHGVVIGAANHSGALDLDFLHAAREAAGTMELVCHRVFDFVPHPFEALDALIQLGFHRILSSGQAPNAELGMHMLKSLVDAAAKRIQIMPGAGIYAGNLAQIVQVTGATDFHMTGKIQVRLPGDKNHIPGLDDAYWVSDVERIQAALQVLNDLKRSSRS